MARYAKVDRRIWNDARFRSLSEAGKLVFLFILTHPSLTMLGAMRASEAGLAAELGVASEGFREAFREALAKGLVKHDPKASFLWLPNFLKYNKPESPNVIKAWPDAFDLIPECDLKAELFERLKDYGKGLSKAFVEAFGEAFPKGYAKDYAEPVTVTVAVYSPTEDCGSEQLSGCASIEPALLDAVLTPPKPVAVVRTRKPKSERQPDPRHAPVWRLICEVYREKNGVNCPDAPRCNGALARFLKGCDWPVEDLAAAIRNRFDSEKPPASEAPHRWLSQLATWRNGPLDAYGKVKTRTTKPPSRRYWTGETSEPVRAGGENVARA